MGSQATFDLIFISGRKGRLIEIKRATKQDLALGHGECRQFGHDFGEAH